MFSACVFRFDDLGMEEGVELRYLVVPVAFSFGDEVEFTFDTGCEIVVEDVGEVCCQIIVDDDAGVGRDKLAFVGAVLQ
ncbi:unknown [Prevotella sp. CAG:1031]|nr:unknown [Prevotella sp. CAG:1031]